MMRWILLSGGCLAAAALGGVAGFYLGFPSTAAADFVEYKVHATNKEYAAEIGSVDPWWFPGGVATDVTFYSVKKARKKVDSEARPLERVKFLHLDALGVRARVIPTLLGKTSFGYRAELLGGSVDGSFTRSDTAMELSFEADGLDLSQAPIQKDDVSVTLGGVVSAAADLVLDTTDVKASSGGLELNFDGLTLGQGSKVMGIELPVVNFTVAKVKMQVNEGKLEVVEGTFDGDQVDMVLSGDISLNKKLERSRNRLTLVVTLPEDLDKLASLAPALKRARDSDGGFHFSIGGTVLSPTFRPGRPSSTKSRGGDDLVRGGDEEPTKPRLLSGDEGGLSEDDPEAAREERRKRREERIKERRERLKKRREEAAQTRGGEPGLLEDGEMGTDRPVQPGGRGPMGGEYGDDMGPEGEPGDFEYPENDMGPGQPPEGMMDNGPPGNDMGPDFEE